MAQGRDLRRAIDRLVNDLTRVAERVIAVEVERAIALATAPVERSARASKARASKGRAPRAERPDAGLARKLRAQQAAELREQRRAEREKERAEREAARARRKLEREQLRQELMSAREAARQARDGERSQAQVDRSAAREAKLKALEAERAAQLAPPPLVVFKRSRDGQVTVLQPRPVEADGTVAPRT
jgi:hypothetical protein